MTGDKPDGEAPTLPAPVTPVGPTLASAAPGVTRSRLPSVAPGMTVGRYEIQAKLGAGGMGIVFRARDPHLARDVALKLVTPGDGDVAIARAGLEREAQAMAKLSHPNVCVVHDIGMRNDQIYIAMELCPGGGLGAWLRADRRPWREVLARFIAAGRGLAAAHRLGLVHRDFKPDNVLVGREEVIKVSDFGLVRSSEPVAATTHGGAGDSIAGSLVGTPAYMAPEQIEGKPALAASDQFAFAVSAWEGLSGVRPFQPEPASADPLGSLLDTISSGKRALPPTTGAPRRIWRALERALEADPAARWPSMDALVDELAAAVAPPRARRWPLFAGVSLGLAGIAIAVIMISGGGESGAEAGRRLAHDADELYVKGDPDKAADVLYEAYRRSNDPVYLRRIGDEWGMRWRCAPALAAYGRYREVRHPLPDLEDQLIRVFERDCKTIAGPKSPPVVGEQALEEEARRKEAAGDTQGAVNDLESALEVHDNPHYLFEIGNLYRRHGQCAEARQEYAWYRDRVPEPSVEEQRWMKSLDMDCTDTEHGSNGSAAR